MVASIPATEVHPKQVVLQMLGNRIGGMGLHPVMVIVRTKNPSQFLPFHASFT
jgi:hypothetical protein